MSTPAVRMPEQADQAEWLRLRQELWPDCAAEQHELEMGTVLADADRAAVFVSPAASTDGERLAGFVELALRPWREECPGSPVGFIEALYVAPNERGGGVGDALLAAAEAWASSRGCRTITADARVDNAAARALHKRRGYEEASERVRLRKRLDAPARASEEGG
jgi:aminoglycoside 6'-N-acetyltransferase I